MGETVRIRGKKWLFPIYETACNLMQLLFCNSDFKNTMPDYHDEVHSGENSSISSRCTFRCICICDTPILPSSSFEKKFI